MTIREQKLMDKILVFMAEEDLLELGTSSEDYPAKDVYRTIVTLIKDGHSSEKVWEYVLSLDDETPEEQ